MEQNNSSIKQRILQYIDSQNISKRQFYIKTGIANGVLDKKTGLAEDNILRLISTFPNINSIWLLTGKGTMLLIPPTDNTAMGIAPSQQLITDAANHNDAFWQTEAFRLSKENHVLLEKISSLMAEITL